MIYNTVCKPGEIFYGRRGVEYKEIYKYKVLTILITENDGIWYNCESYDLNEEVFPSTEHFPEEDFKTFMFKTPEAAKRDLEQRTKLYEQMDDYMRELKFEDNLILARKLVEEKIVKLEELQDFCNFSEEEYRYVKDLFMEQMESV